ncbi:MAG: gulonolactone oxidase Lgo1 [Lentinula lateritia]|uniref:D-arabinono-1,4-lactone oxidase n=1 Tax=Lentinula lateritia TaxID=40482 RepID=A0ABQ8VW84_9AGAR|nr:MAG: gulonolactone oxidase Lgo1 [Lentinula lateritia]KAJ4500585.1 gulonolactone oxidase Lgo1 [Lentinula lateritia]
MSSRFKVDLHDIPLHKLYEILLPVTAPSNAVFSNWAETFICTPLAIFEPRNEYHCELILELARREGKVVRVTGVGHSPSDLACTNEFMLRTTHLNRVLTVDKQERRVVVQGGITLHQLHASLAQHGLAMINLGSISDQTLAGIVTTASHGTGIDYGVMSTQVISMIVLLADGSRVYCSRNEQPDLFLATVCGLGSTGLILNIELEVESSFHLEEVLESRSFEDTLSNLKQLVHSSEHTRFFWFPATDMMRVSMSNRTHETKRPGGSWFYDSFMGYHLVQLLLFLGIFFRTCNTWAVLLASWLVSSVSSRVDDSYRVFNVECRYLQHTTEWAIPYENVEPCLRKLRKYFHEILVDPRERPHFPIEIRFSAPDDIWLSPSYNQQTCWIGIVQYKPYGFNIPYRKLFEGFENILSVYQGRPHWAKAHKIGPQEFRTLYPHFEDFLQVLQKVDPKGLFRNEYMQRHFFGLPVDGRLFKQRK